MLLVTAFFGFIFALFATQNTSPASIAAGPWKLNNVPVYWIVLGSLLGGLFISWVINFFESVAAGLALSRKEKELKRSTQSVNELNQKIQFLEVENAQLKKEEPLDSQTQEELVIPRHQDKNPNLFERIRQNLSF